MPMENQARTKWHMGIETPARPSLLTLQIETGKRGIGKGIDSLSNTPLHEKEVAFGANSFGKDMCFCILWHRLPRQKEDAPGRTNTKEKESLARRHFQLLPWHFYKESWAVIVSISRQTWGSINKKVIIILIIITTQMITMQVIIIKALLCLSPSFAHPLNLLNVQKLGVSIHSALSSNCIWFGRHNFNHNIRKRGESCGVLIVGYY